MESSVKKGFRRTCLAGVVLSAGLSVSAMSGDVTGSASGVYANIGNGMSISGPKGFHKEVKNDTYIEGTLPDGTYRYEIYGDVEVENDSFDSKTSMNNGRSPDAKKNSKGEGVIASGHFKIKNGSMFEPGNEKEE